MAISDLVTSTLSIADSSPSRRDFGTLCIFGDAPYIGARLYTADPSGLAAMVTDGFSAKDRAYQIAQVVAAQSNGSDQFWVYARAVSHAQTFDLTPTNTTEDFVYTFDISAWDTAAQTTTAISYTVAAAATVASVCTGIHALVNAVVGVTATDDTTHITMTPTTAGTYVFADNTPRDLQIDDEGTDAGIATDLAAAVIAIEDAGGDFYGVLLDSLCEAELNAARVWCDANSKILGGHTSDYGVIDSGDSTDVASDFSGASSHYGAIMFSRASMSSHVGAAGLSQLFALRPGQGVFANRTLQGPTGDKLSPTEKSTARGKKANVYISSAGINHTLDGWAGSGRYLDVTRNNDWFQYTCELAVFQALMANEIVPYTDAGLVILEAALRGVCNLAKRQGVLAEGWTLDVVAVADTLAVDRTARVYNGFTINGQIQGAIQTVDFQIFLKV